MDHEGRRPPRLRACRGGTVGLHSRQNGNGICHVSLLPASENLTVRCSIREPQSGQYRISRGLLDSASRSALRDRRRDLSLAILGDLSSSAQGAAGGSKFCVATLAVYSFHQRSVRTLPKNTIPVRPVFLRFGICSENKSG